MLKLITTNSYLYIYIHIVEGFISSVNMICNGSINRVYTDYRCSSFISCGAGPGPGLGVYKYIKRLLT